MCQPRQQVDSADEDQIGDLRVVEDRREGVDAAAEEGGDSAARRRPSGARVERSPRLPQRRIAEAPVQRPGPLDRLELPLVAQHPRADRLPSSARRRFASLASGRRQRGVGGRFTAVLVRIQTRCGSRPPILASKESSPGARVRSAISWWGIGCAITDAPWRGSSRSRPPPRRPPTRRRGAARRHGVIPRPSRGLPAPREVGPPLLARVARPRAATRRSGAPTSPGRFEARRSRLQLRRFGGESRTRCVSSSIRPLSAVAAPAPRRASSSPQSSAGDGAGCSASSPERCAGAMRAPVEQHRGDLAGPLARVPIGGAERAGSSKSRRRPTAFCS